MMIMDVDMVVVVVDYMLGAEGCESAQVESATSASGRGALQVNVSRLLKGGGRGDAGACGLHDSSEINPRSPFILYL